MPLLDRERNLIVIRVVYDGPPEAGKTTSLRALAGSLGQALYTPAEQDGRTLYFDWMDYTGGRFEGFQIRCQITSVPGQRELRARRQRLLREADVVVFVGDTTAPELERTLAMLTELPVLVADVPPPPVGVILQANKRDRPDAVPLHVLRTRVRASGWNIGVVESIASDGTGIREAFVFAVRLALDRVREQLRTHTLPTGQPAIDSGELLLAAMRADEGGCPPALPSAAPLVQQVLAENDPDARALTSFAPWVARRLTAATDERGPAPPDADAPSGAIWPPVEGRLILHEAAPGRMSTHRLAHDGWAAGLGEGWRIYSGGDAVYADLEQGREMLIRWARLHAASSSVISPSRCIVLAATGHGDWRLWQIVRAERSLREELDDIERCGTDEAAARIVDTAALLCEMTARLDEARCPVPCSLDTVGRGERGPMYVGLMPTERDALPPSHAEPFESELDSLFRNALYERRADVIAAIARASRLRSPSAAALLDQLVARGAGG